MDVVYAVAIGQGLFFAIFLLFQKQKSFANRLLITYLLLICFILFNSYLNETGLIRSYPFMIGLDSGIPYLCGPFLWFYFRLVTGKSEKLTWRASLHLIPFVIHYTYVYLTLISKSDLYKLALLDSGLSSSQLLSLVISNGVKIAHGMVYYAMAYKLLKGFGEKISNAQSGKAMTHLKWLRSLLLLLITVTGFMGLSVVALLFPGLNVSSLFIPLVNVSLFILIYVIVFYALKHPHIFLPTGITNSLMVKYAQSSITEEESKRHWEQLRSRMDSDKLYRKSDLTLTELASQVSLNPKVLSQIINENSGENFFNFINKFRVEEFKTLARMGEHKHLTLLAIASECGFSSKTSFYSAFRKVEKVTPKAYLETNMSDFRK